MHKILFLLILPLFLFSKNIKIASYNVENFFDLKYDKTEYEEYIPNTKSLWNQRNFYIKLKNIIKVIEDLDADIIALQEIENLDLMKLLVKKLPQYKYYNFIKYPRSAVGLGFLSKIEIKRTASLDVKFPRAVYRPILETTFTYNGVEFKIFNNHWPSKRANESYRIKFAKTLYDRTKELEGDYDYIILGDLNSDYNEFETFKRNLKLNTTAGITGINNLLKTTINNEFITIDDILTYKQKVHYNLWLDIPTNERFSTKFREQNNTPDNILLSPALFDGKKLSYVLNSFEVFKPNYLFNGKNIIRWKMQNLSSNQIHKGEGFSDHLPIFAYFSIKDIDKKPLKNLEKQNILSIKELYKTEKLINPAILEDIIVIYKDDNKAIIKEKNSRAIYIFKDAKDLKLGFKYSLQINSIIDFYGLKEINDFLILEEKDEEKNFKDLYLDASKIDIFDFKYENEIITNLKGFIKKGRLQINGGKTIKLFSSNKELLPKDGEIILIKSGHLASYRGNMQIIIHKNSDYGVLK